MTTSKNSKNSVEMYKELLCGRGNRGQYKNSNLVIIDSLPQSLQERSKTNISPPTNLNPDYEQFRPQQKKAKKNKEKKEEAGNKGINVDPRVLQRLLGNGSK